MNNTTNETVRVTKSFDASPERVFDAWLDAETAGKWLFATPDGKIVRCEIDPQVGGKFTITDRREGVDVEHIGEYLEIERPHRLVFTFSVPKYSDVVTKVTIEIVPIGDGCELTLVHENVLTGYEERTFRGWTEILSNLAKTLF